MIISQHILSKYELNIYDLYIPRYAENRKNETNGIMLWIHGGWWIGGNLAMTSSLCELYGQLGYISANVNYTLLNDEYKVFNIYRIMKYGKYSIFINI